MVDSVYRTRSLGVAATGLPDQYADGKAAKVWEYYIGCKTNRTSQYKSWITSLLKSKNCANILDVACGTGVDSMMLLEAGFNVHSTDASDRMLKYALKERWARRKEPEFDKWVIEEANWLTLVDDLEDIETPEGGYDAVLCLGNSFAHLPDFEGNLQNQKVALSNFRDMVKPGGMLVIDHRNYDAILDLGKAPAKNIYYNSEHINGIKCSNLYVNGKPTMVTLDYTMDMQAVATPGSRSEKKFNLENSTHRFRLSYYPHRLEAFNDLLSEIFGNGCHHTVYGDFKPHNKEETPAYFIHIVEKAAEPKE